MKKKIAVFVSGGGTNLQAILDACDNEIIKSGTVSAVISDKPDVYALKRAQKHGVKAYVCDKKSLGGKDAFEREASKILDENNIDLIVLAGFLTVLSEGFVKKYKIINVHPSLIPSFCGDGFYGLKVHEAVLKRGVKVTGATVHFVNEITDGGKIIMQKAVCVLDGDTPEILQKRVMEQAEWIILPQAIEKICAEN